MSRENPKPGDVFMLRDLEYSKKDGDIPDNSVKTIKFDRPCIVLNIQRELVQVIPMTTHHEKHSFVYKLQIQDDKTSGALLSQVTTVELNRLDSYIGKMKANVFENLKHSYFKYIEGTANKKKPMRSVPRLFNHLDIYRYFSFHIYFNKITKETFLCVKSLKGHYWFIPIFRCKCRNLEILTVCGYVDIDNMRMITDKDYCDDFIDMGEEYRSATRNIIQHEIYIKRGMTVYTKLYIDTWSDISWCIHELFGYNRYLSAFKTLKSIIKDCKLQQEFLKKPKLLLPQPIKDFELNEIRFKLIEVFIMSFVDPLTCSINLLKKIKDNDTELFESVISPFREAVYTRNSSKRLFDGESIYNTYKIENLRFIADYCRKK